MVRKANTKADAETAEKTAEPQTEAENEPDTSIVSGMPDADSSGESVVQTGLEISEKGSPSPEESSEFLNSMQISQTDTEIVSDSEPENEDGVEFSNPPQNQTRSDTQTRKLSSLSIQNARLARSQAQLIIPIDEERTVESEFDKEKNNLLDMLESKRARKIVSGTLEGVERLNGNTGPARAVLYHGDYKILIPAEEFLEAPMEPTTNNLDDTMYHLIIKRLGAEIDYIVKGIDSDANIAVASRLEAMRLKRRNFYNRRNQSGEYILHEGVRAEVRVISVTRMSVFVDLFGLEVRIPVSEATYQHVSNLSSMFQPGQRVLVRILKIDRQTGSKPNVYASIKRAYKNPYEQALQRYEVGNRYTGTVSMVSFNGVYVSLSSGVDCLCNFPRRGRPPKGARVTVIILGVDYDTNKIWGNIVHVVNPTI